MLNSGKNNTCALLFSPVSSPRRQSTEAVRSTYITRNQPGACATRARGMPASPQRSLNISIYFSVHIYIYILFSIDIL